MGQLGNQPMLYPTHILGVHDFTYHIPNKHISSIPRLPQSKLHDYLASYNRMPFSLKLTIILARGKTK